MKLLRLLALLVIGFSASAFAQCAAFPCVVATVSLTNQSQTIPATPMFTPSATGLYRLTSYMTTSTGTTDAYWTIEVGWTDNRGFKKGYLGGASQNAASIYPPFLVQATAGQPLLYQILLHGGGKGSGGMTYDLYITVEQLQ